MPATPHRRPSPRVPRHRAIAVAIGRAIRALVALAVLVALVVGIPWALIRFIGWPLPDQMPTWTQVQLTLLGPMTAGFVLDALACVLWVAWAAFTLDVLACAVDATRDISVSRRLTLSPTHALAAALVGAVVMSVLSNRSVGSSSRTILPTAAATPIVATAPAWTHASHLGLLPTADTPRAQQGRAPIPESVIVRAPDPRTGVHDSLWRIADRILGDGSRWPEIYQLNHGKPQPGGGTLTRPSLIFPGEELRLPAAVAPAPHNPEPGASASESSAAPSATSASPSARPSAVSDTPAHAPAQPGPTAPAEPGHDVAADVFLGAGVAAAISAALWAVRRRRRRLYQPGSGRRDDLPVAPTVYRLDLAHLRSRDNEPGADDGTAIDPDLDADPDPDLDTDWSGPSRPQSSPPLTLFDTTAPDNNNSQDGDDACDGDSAGDSDGAGSAWTLSVGTRDGREVALALATTHGLGLVGDGAMDAARALLITVRTTAGAAVEVFVPADDLAELLGGHPAHTPQAFRVTPTLDDALAQLEQTLFTHASDQRPNPANGPVDARVDPVRLLVGRPSTDTSERLQALLDNGSSFGILGLLVGQWRPGVTAYVRPDGTVSATSPGRGEALRGTRLFQVGADQAVELLALLSDAETAETPQPRPTDIDTDRATTDLEVIAVSAVADPPDPHRGERSDPAEHSDTTEYRAEVDAGDHEYGGRRPIRVAMLGQLSVVWHDGDDVGVEKEITGRLQPRSRELLVFLGLHPGGVSRETAAATLWPESSPDRAANSLNSALNRLRTLISRATGAGVRDVLAVTEGRVGLDPAIVRVDYWEFTTAVVDGRSARNDTSRLTANERVVTTYGGELADGMTAAWVAPVREAVRRDAIDAVSAVARALVTTDPHRTLDLLESARAFDPYNEMLYRDIMRLQERLGFVDAIPRTLALLTTRMNEISDQPDDATVDLATRLRQRYDERRSGPDSQRRPRSDNRADNRTAAG